MGNIYVAKCEYASVYDEEGSCEVVINVMQNITKMSNVMGQLKDL